MIVLIAAGAIWLVLAFTRKRTLMLTASAILAGAWLIEMWRPLPSALAVPLRAAAPTKASMIAALSTGSCATIAEGMSTAEVRSRMGESDETRNDEEARGPGASILIYRASRCAVHVLDGKVELIE
jgi:hypothetical protein